MFGFPMSKHSRRIAGCRTATWSTWVRKPVCDSLPGPYAGPCGVLQQYGAAGGGG
jgi:hypothetical protein